MCFSFLIEPSQTFIISLICHPYKIHQTIVTLQFSSVQSLSHVRLFVTPWIAEHQASCPSLTPRVYSNSCPSSRDAIQPSHPLSSPSPPAPIPPSIRVFSKESALHMRWPKYWSFSFSIIPSKEHPGLISFRMDWLGLLAVQGTLKSLLQHHRSKASVLWCSAFFTVQLSHPYMTTGWGIFKEYTLNIPWSRFRLVKQSLNWKLIWVRYKQSQHYQTFEPLCEYE